MLYTFKSRVPKVLEGTAVFVLVVISIVDDDGDWLEFVGRGCIICELAGVVVLHACYFINE